MKSIIILVSLILILLIGCKNDVTSPNSKEVYIGYAVGDSGKVYKSSDNGNTWEQKQSGITSKLNSVCVITSSIAIAVGNNGIIIKTTDAGNSWNVQQSGTSENLTKIIFNKPINKCWISGEQGLLLNSSNY
jgi:photosystem II stability/assembly factor-like uncharacterized protein